MNRADTTPQRIELRAANGDLFVATRESIGHGWEINHPYGCRAYWGTQIEVTREVKKMMAQFCGEKTP